MKKKLLFLAMSMFWLANTGPVFGQCVQTAPWTEDFENAGSIPACWSQGATNDEDWEFADDGGFDHIGSDGVINGTTTSGNYFAWVDDSSPNSTGTALLSPMIDVSGLTDPMLEFFRLSDNEGNTNVDFSVDVWDGATWNTGVYSSNSNSFNEAWEYIQVGLSGLSITGDIQIRFVVDENNGTDFYDDVAIDDVGVVEAPSCLAPNSFAATNVTGTTVDFEWVNGGTETMWNIEYGPAGYTQGTGTTVAANSNPFEVTGLTAITDYDFYIQADCGGGDESSWLGPVNVNTLIESVNCTSGTNTVFFEYDFESGFPSDWTNTAIGDPQWETNTGTTPTGSTGPNGAFSGNGYLFFESGFSAGDPDTIYPVSNVDLSTSLNEAKMSFYYHMYGATMGELHVEISDDGGSTWVSEFSQIGEDQTADTDPWTPVEIDLTPYLGSVIEYRIIGVRGTGSTGDMAIDLFKIESCVDCPQPSNFVATNVTGTTADFEWVNGGSETSWNIEYGTTGYTQGTGTTVVAGTNPFTVTGLNGATSYDFYIQAECGPGDESVWVGPINVNTLVESINCTSGTNTPFFESDFESGFPSGWTNTATGNPQWEFNTGTTVSSNTGPNNAFSGSGYLFLETSGGTQGDADTIYPTSNVNLTTALNEAKMSFYYHMFGADMGELIVDVSDDGGATWTTEFTQVGQDQTAESDTWTPVDIDLTAYIGSTIEYRIIGVRGDGFESDMAIDLFKIETCVSCPQPSNLEVSNISASSADLDWLIGDSETEWEVEYGAPGFALGTGTPVSVTTNPEETITGLSGNTTYDVYVRAVCGPGDESVWVGPITFTTECNAFSAPFSENFDGPTWLTGTGVNNAGDQLAQCWSRDPSQQTSNAFWGVRTGGTSAFSSGPDADVSGSGKYVYFESSYGGSGDSAFIYTPSIDLSGLTLPELNFSYHMYGSTMGDIAVEVSSDGGSTWDNVWFISGEQQDDGSDPWLNTTLLLPAYINETIIIRFIGIKDGTNGDAAIDEVVVEEAPSCPEPSDLSVSNITDTEAEIQWTVGYLETEWEIEYDTTGFTQGNGTVVTTTDNPETLTGLTDNTSYDVYLRAMCGPGDESVWIGPVSFSTQCLIFPTPFEENFDGSTWVSGNGGNNSDAEIDGCWSNTPSTSSDLFWGTRTGTTVSGTTGPSSDVSGQGNYIVTEGTNGSNGDTAVFDTPQIDLSMINDPQLVFNYHMYGADIDSLNVQVSNDGGNTFANLFTVEGQQQFDNSDDWIDTTLSLAAYENDTVVIRFRNSKSGFNTDIGIDEISILSCIPDSGVDDEVDICRSDENINLNDQVTINQGGGKWSFPANESAINNDIMLDVTSLPEGTYEAYYIVKGACQDDTTTATLNIFPPSSAGESGTLIVCRNQPVDLFSGLSGSIDLGGTWFDPSENALPNSLPYASDIPGSYNYDYVVSNGVCPSDTQYVQVLVDECDWLSVEEEEMMKIEVYPNPASDILNINNGSNMEHMTIKMFDMNGRLVYSDDQSLSNTDNTTISIDHLEKGVYTLRVGNQEGQKTFKIVKH